MGNKDLFESNKDFWNFAGFVDINGPHQMDQYLNVPNKRMLIDQITAFWAWSRTNIPHQRSNPGEYLDVTSYINSSKIALEHIFNMNPEYIQAGKDFQLNEYAMSRQSMKKIQKINIENDMEFIVFF